MADPVGSIFARSQYFVFSAVGYIEVEGIFSTLMFRNVRLFSTCCKTTIYIATLNKLFFLNS